MKKDRILYILFVVLRWVLGAVFVYAGFVKLLDPKAFAKVIAQYDVIPQILLPAVAVGLPALELLAGLGLILMIRGSLSVIFSLLLLFVLVLGYGLLNNLNVDCGCFSEEEMRGFKSLRISFYRDLLMIAAASYIYVYRKRLQQGKLSGLARSEDKIKEK
jgi:uncharacterized membrane protein YphA (DoxX/SURF4 family)